MPDLLTHALLAYSLVRLLSWRYDWITTPYVTAGMAGAFIPDIVKIELVLPDDLVEHLLGIPFSWTPLQTLGGAVVCVLIGAVLVDEASRRKALLVLSLGAASHLLADAMLLKASGRSFAVLWPLTRWHPPTPGLYLSTQPEPTILAVFVAAGVWMVSRRVESTSVTGGD